MPLYTQYYAVYSIMCQGVLQIDAQLKRGVLESCVLSALSRGDSYGYQIIKDLSEVMVVSESTLYPILKRLESGGFVRSYSMAHNGRLRRYYAVTQAGIARIGEFLDEWQEIARVCGFIEEGYKK